MRQCVMYLKELFLGAPYRKSIWFFIILWILTFLLSDYISYSGLYYLILLIATIVLLLEKCGVLDSEAAIRKRFLTYFYVIFFLCMLPTLAVTLVFSAVGISHYDTQRWHSTWPSSKAGYIPTPLQTPKSLPESLKVISSAEVIGIGGNQSCLVLDGDKATISQYEESVKSNAWYSFINGREKDTTVKLLREFKQPKDRSVLFSDVDDYYKVITIRRQNWKLFPWLINGTQSVGDDPDSDYYYSTRMSAEKYVVYVVYHNFDQDQPRVIYFMFNPERTRMITMDIDFWH
ncbi:MAG: hypothetical protein E7J93_04875 [Veillonella sp.]|uniref:hypothetical protein n=1 Tax=unclassified Veillonella TaxID=2630086 RepID=UPI00044D1D81|nr:MULTISPECIES: hypothetical protein [unclassified Veillonella]EUB25392.1 hypothetical protein HMPREF1504_0241 [Veillonella sp. ICM51a]MDU7715665.1 hypothetical protein [Veillonella sp.]PQL24305.1 hypothetical protein VIHSUH07_01725 [Veillonella sp. T34266-5]